jgi:hypothetical protein
MQFRPKMRRSQIIRLGVWLGAMVAGTLVSLGQAAPGQFKPPAPAGGLRWWVTPIEENVFFRPPVTRAGLGGVFFLPGKTYVGWAVAQVAQSSIPKTGV